MKSILEKTGIKLNITPRSQIVAAAVTGVLAVFIAMHLAAFFDTEVILGKLQLLWTALAALGAGLLMLVQPEAVNERGKKLQRRTAAVLFALLPILSLCMIEFLHGTFIYNWSPLTFVQNYCFMLILYLLVYAVSGSFCLPVMICSIAGYIFGIANHFVMAFRGTPFLPGDLSSAETGLSVAAGYDFTPDNQVLLSTALLVLLCVIARRLRLPKDNRPDKRITRTVRVLGAVLAAVFCVLLFRTNWFADNGMKPDFFNQARGYTNRGSLFQFVINTKYLHVVAPEDYSAEDTDAIVEDLLDDAEVPPQTVPKTLPNIICVMNETFSDLSAVGEFEVNQDPLPFLHSLTENTVKGFVHVPVYGAGTANSEFEFLTGDSLAFLPMGSCAYESYVKGPHPSLVSALDMLGYDKTAFHPYYGENWSRNEVYMDLGFDRFMDISTILGEDIVAEYRVDKDFAKFSAAVREKYPDDKVFMRRYVSDEFDYKKVIEAYEQDRGGAPFFMFNVTMQNHSGYRYHQPDFFEDVYLTGEMEGKYPMANQYLTLIHHADEALKGLLDYFSEVDEPTVICLFGDHQASIEPEFYEELFGKPLEELTIEEKAKMYMTPFIIWANYDIEEETVEAISANYLSALVMQTAGLPMTTYQQYLLELHKTLPIINTVGYRDAAGNWYALDDETSPYTELLEDYRKVQYNHLLDNQNRVNELFIPENLKG